MGILTAFTSRSTQQLLEFSIIVARQGPLGRTKNNRNVLTSAAPVVFAPHFCYHLINGCVCVCVDTSSKVIALRLLVHCLYYIKVGLLQQGAVTVDSLTDRPCLVNMFNINHLQSEPFGGAVVSFQPCR